MTEITHETKGIITPFGALQRGSEFENGTKPFWLYEYTTGGSFAESDGIRSMEPAKRNANAEYYQLDGTKRTSLQRGFNIIRTPDGKTQKALVK